MDIPIIIKQVRDAETPEDRLAQFETALAQSCPFPSEVETLTREFLQCSLARGNVVLAAAGEWFHKARSQDADAQELLKKAREHYDCWTSQSFKKKLSSQDWGDFFFRRGAAVLGLAVQTLRCLCLNGQVDLTQFLQELSRVLAWWDGADQKDIQFNGASDLVVGSSAPIMEIFSALLGQNPLHADTLGALRCLVRQWTSPDLPASVSQVWLSFADGDGLGYSRKWVVERRNSGTPADLICYPDPLYQTFIPMDDTFRESLKRARASLEFKPPKIELSWRVEPDWPQLRGASAGVVMAVGLALAAKGISTPQEVPIGGSARIGNGGQAEPVREIKEKFQAFSEASQSGYFICSNDQTQDSAMTSKDSPVKWLSVRQVKNAIESAVNIVVLESEQMKRRKMSKFWNNDLLRDYEELFEKSDIVVSAPGTFFFGGEKAVLCQEGKGIASCMKVSRRILVGLKAMPRTEAVELKLFDSKVLSKNSSSQKYHFQHYAGEHDPLSYALIAASSAFRALEGKGLSRGYGLRILSEWEGEYGLGWSSAFAAALAQAIALAEGVTDQVVEPDPLGKNHTENTDWVMRLGWCIDAVLHGGRASGSGVFGSLSNWCTPYSYWVEDPDKVERFWAADADGKEISHKVGQIDTFKKLIREAVWHGQSVLGAQWTRENDEKSMRTLFGDRLKDVLILHSNVRKSTAKSAIFELQHNKRQGNGLDTTAHYEALIETCRFLNVNLTLAFESSLNPNLQQMNEHWKAVCDLVTRLQGCLASLGFSFPVGDEVLGRVARIFANEKDGGSLGGKLTGGGLGGSLVIVVSASALKTVDSLLNSVHHPCQIDPEISVTFSLRDGWESAGLLLEKS